MSCRIVRGHSEAIRRVKECSENPVTGSSRVNFSESGSSDDVQSTFSGEAFVLVESVGSHTLLESAELIAALLFKDGLTGRTFIFTRESGVHKNHESRRYNLPSDSLVNEGRLLRGTTEHVAHIFHWHID